LGIGRTIKIQKIKATGIWEEKQDIIPGELLLNIFINGKRVSILSWDKRACYRIYYFQWICR